MMSAGVSVMDAWPSRRRASEPSAEVLSTRAGSAKTSRLWSSVAILAVMSAPDFLPASMTSTPSESPEMMRFLAGKFEASGGVSMGSAETTAPRSCS